MSFGSLATTAELIARVRDRADMVGSAIVDDPEIADYLNDAQAELHDLLEEVFGEDYFVRTNDLTVSAGASSVAFTAPYLSPWRLLRIDRVQNNYRRPIERFSLADTVLDETARDWDSHPPRYDWRYTTINFDPPTSKQETIRIYFVPYPQVFASTNPNEVLELYTHGHHRFLVVSAAIQCLGKQESDATQLIAERDHIERMIRSTTGPKDIGRPPTIVDAQGLADERDPVQRFDYR